MVHHQFETLHPFNDGNGRIGRLLVVMHLVATGTLTEPSLTVSPWFEARRAAYFDHLNGVSTAGRWDGWLTFFANGLRVSAEETERLLLDLLAVQVNLKETARAEGLRAESAARLIDLVVERPYVTARQVERHLDLTSTRSDTLISQLVTAGILRNVDDSVHARRFFAPDVLAVLLRAAE